MSNICAKNNLEITVEIEIAICTCGSEQKLARYTLSYPFLLHVLVIVTVHYVNSHMTCIYSLQHADITTCCSISWGNIVTISLLLLMLQKTESKW